MGVGRSVSRGVGVTSAVGDGVSIGSGVGVDVDVAVGTGVGATVGSGIGVGVGVGVKVGSTVEGIAVGIVISPGRETADPVIPGKRRSQEGAHKRRVNDKNKASPLLMATTSFLTFLPLYNTCIFSFRQDGNIAQKIRKLFQKNFRWDNFGTPFGLYCAQSQTQKTFSR